MIKKKIHIDNCIHYFKNTKNILSIHIYIEKYKYKFEVIRSNFNIYKYKHSAKTLNKNRLLTRKIED